MSTSAAFAPPPARRLPAGLLLLAWPHSARVCEHLVVLAPLFLMPLAGTPADILVLTLVFALLISADMALATAPFHAPQWTSAAMLGAGLWLATAALFGMGAMLTFGLFLMIRCLERQVPAASWRLRLALAALATALVVDLSLVTLALERSSLWLALAASIGTGFAAARMLAAGDPDHAPAAHHDTAAADHRNMQLEVVLVTALTLVLAFYGALLSHEPALAGKAVTGGYLTVPLLALAVLRLALVALAPDRRQGVDPLAVLLLAGWALAATSLFDAP